MRCSTASPSPRRRRRSMPGRGDRRPPRRLARRLRAPPGARGATSPTSAPAPGFQDLRWLWRPRGQVTLVESVDRKAASSPALPTGPLSNAEALHAARSRPRPLRPRHRPSACRPPVVPEYAAPLLEKAVRRCLWRGRRDADEERERRRLRRRSGSATRRPLRAPFSRRRHRHLHSYVKVAPTPERFPRRAGMARKRPLGGRPWPSLPS